MNREQIFVVTQEDHDEWQPNYIYPYFHHTEEDAIRNAKARAVFVGEENWAEHFPIRIFQLADEALLRTQGEQQ